MNAYPANRNRLLELEQELLRKRAAFAGQAQVSVPQNSPNPAEIGSLFALEQQVLQPEQLPDLPKPTHRIVHRHVFDWNEPIQLQYCWNDESDRPKLPQTTQQAIALTHSEESSSQPSVLSASKQNSLTPTHSPQTLEEALKTIPPSHVGELMDAIRTLLRPPNPATRSSPPAPVAESIPNPVFDLSPHDLFRQMGSDGTYATAFDLGTVEVEELDGSDRPPKSAEPDPAITLTLKQQFEAFDRLLNQEEEISHLNFDANPFRFDEAILEPEENPFQWSDELESDAFPPLLKAAPQGSTLLPIKPSYSLERPADIDLQPDDQKDPIFFEKLSDLFSRIALNTFASLELMHFLHHLQEYLNRLKDHRIRLNSVAEARKPSNHLIQTSKK
jgi:hypothetical protein